MTHPTNRAERRHNREVSRNRRRTYLFIGHWFNKEPQDNTAWNKGGKQYQGHGNRCMHSMIPRHEHHMEVKALRRDRNFEKYLIL